MTADALVPLVAALLIAGAGIRMLRVQPSAPGPRARGIWRTRHPRDAHAAQTRTWATPSRRPATMDGGPTAIAGTTATEASARYHIRIPALVGEPMALPELPWRSESPWPTKPRGDGRPSNRWARWRERVRLALPLSRARWATPARSAATTRTGVGPRISGLGTRRTPTAMSERAARESRTGRLRIMLAVVLCVGSLAMAQLAQQSDQRSGWVALAPAVALGLLVARRRLKERRTAKARFAAQVEAAPAVVDLLAACLTAGLNGHLALIRVAERCPAALRQEFTQVAADLRVGQSPAVALRGAAERTGLAELRAAAGALHAGERWGAPPAEALAARSEALRARLRLEAEATAERAAVRLTFPLVLCFLPAFVSLTVVPMLAGAVRALGI